MTKEINKNATCFVLMPFGKKGTEEHKTNKDIFENIIVPAVKAASTNIQCLRADMINKSGSIIKDIIEHLNMDDIVIADLSGKNVNVFYELGVRHALSRRSILISQNIEDVPFDLRPYRVALYAYPKDEEERFDAKIKAFIDDILNNPGSKDSPVSDYLPTIEISNLRKEIKISFHCHKLPESSGALHKYRLEIEIKNDGNKTINGINMEIGFPGKIPVDGKDFIRKGEEIFLVDMYYNYYHSQNMIILQPGKSGNLSIDFQVNENIHYKGMLNKSFYWTIFADDMSPIKGNEILNDYTNY